MRLTLMAMAALNSGFWILDSGFPESWPHAQSAIEERFGRAVGLQKQGSFKEAEAEYRAILVESPNYAEAHANLAAVLIRMDRYEEAVSEYQTALRLASHLLRGQSLLSRGEFEKAIVELELAAGLNADLPRLQYSLGLCYFKIGRTGEAVTAFGAELKRAPRDFSSLYYLAYLREEEGNLAAARSRLEAALALEPDSAEANALLGKILVKQGKAAEAVKPLEAAVAKDPEDGEKRYQLARVYLQLGLREEAAREFAESQRLKARQLQRDRERIPKP